MFSRHPMASVACSGSSLKVLIKTLGAGYTGYTSTARLG